MTKIVGHRGAVSHDLENTIGSFKAAKKLGVDAIEFDIQRTKDGKFVVIHDEDITHDDLYRLSGHDGRVSEMTYAELAEIKLYNHETVPLLYDVLSLIDSTPVVLDVITDEDLPGFFAILDKFPHMDFTIVTRLPEIIPKCKQLRPDIPVFVRRHFSPFALMWSVRKYGADGLNLNFRWLNPLTYWAIRRKGMQIQAYTVNSVLIARIIKKLYPGVWICTNHPDKFLAALSDKKTVA